MDNFQRAQNIAVQPAKKSFLWLYITIGVVIVAVIGVGAYFLLSQGGKSGEVFNVEKDTYTITKQAQLSEGDSNLRTYTFTMKMEMETKMDFGGQSLDISGIQNWEGKIDRDNKKIYSKMTPSGSYSKYAGGGGEIELYTFEDFSYIHMGSFFGWMKTPNSNRDWENQDSMRNLIEILDTGLLKEKRTETIDGTTYEVIESIPNPDKVAEIMNKQRAQSSVKQKGKSKTIINSLTIWVNKNTNIIEKEILDMEIITNPGKKDERGAKSKINFEIFNVNEPVEITLPKEAKEATEMPSYM